MSRPLPVTVGGRRPKSRGNRFEAEVCNILRAHGWERARRNLGSGGYGGNDIVDGPEAVAIECKNTERLAIWRAIEQCEAAARPTDIPVLVFTRNRSDIYAALPLDDLLELLKLRDL